MNIFDFYSILFKQIIFDITYPHFSSFCVAYWLRTLAIYSAMPTLYPQLLKPMKCFIRFVD